MYCNNKGLFFNKNFNNNDFKELKLDRQLVIFNYIKDLFNDELRRLNKKKDWLVDNDPNKVYKYKQYQKFNRKLEQFVSMTYKIIYSKQSINWFFKNNSYSRATWFRTKRVIIEIALRLNQRLNIDWNKYLDKLPIPKTVKYKYSNQDDLKLLKFYHLYLNEYPVFEITDFTLKLRIGYFISNKKHNIFNDISLNTVKKKLRLLKVIKAKVKQKYNENHPERKYVASEKNFQLDLKVLGRKETKVGKPIYIFTLINVLSRMTYTSVLENGTSNEVLKALQKAKVYFEKLGLKIGSIQTDNAMMFKGTNFVTSNEYNKFLYENNIEQRFIPLGVPQCNGCIERYHKTIDDRAGTLLRKCRIIAEVKEVINRFFKFYNNKRYHYYSELKYFGIKYAQRFIIPKLAIKTIYNLVGFSGIKR